MQIYEKVIMPVYFFYSPHQAVAAIGIYLQLYKISLWDAFGIRSPKTVLLEYLNPN